MASSTSAHDARASAGSYRERLFVPLRWWVQATMLLATLWLAFIVSMPAAAAWTATAVLVLITFAGFAWIGSARVEVRDGVLYAGTAHISVALLGPVEPLDAEETRRVHGVDADARAFLVTRPYLKRVGAGARARPRRPHAVLADLDAAPRPPRRRPRRRGTLLTRL